MSVTDVDQILALYKKTKKDWNTNSSVRDKTSNYDLNFDEIKNNENLNFYNSTYSTILEHDGLKNINDNKKKYVMALQLLEFVEKTTIFEVEYVNKVAQKIALGKYNLKIPKTLKLDAFKIYTDEGYHAYITKKTADDIREFYNINDDISPLLENFFNKINKIGIKFGKEYTYLSELSSALVSESSVVQDMSGEMKGLVYEPVRLMFKDHIHDEMFHANFFRTLFKIIWLQLNDKEKEIMGDNLFEAIVVFSKPRTDIYYHSLSKLGFDIKFIDKCVGDTFGFEEININKIKSKMSHILHLLDQCGVFQVEKVRNKFKINKLI